MENLWSLAITTLLAMEVNCLLTGRDLLALWWLRKSKHVSGNIDKKMDIEIELCRM